MDMLFNKMKIICTLGVFITAIFFPVVMGENSYTNDLLTLEKSNNFLSFNINNNPTADFIWTPENPTEWEKITFDASSSYDPNDEIIGYIWDFNNDGNFEKNGITTDHYWEFPGNYPVTLRIENATGITDNITKTVTVNENTEPSAEAGAMGQDGTGFARGTFILIDEDNHDLYYKIVDYDDGTEPSDWFGPKKSRESIVFEHQFPERGKYRVRLQTRDDPAKDGWDGPDGKSFDFSFPIKRGRPHLNLFKLEIHNLFLEKSNNFLSFNINNNPTADFIWTPENPTEWEKITFDASSSYDPNDEIIGYIWDFNNDGNFEKNGITTDHYWEFPGNYPVTLRIENATGITDNITKTVTVNENTEPSATIGGKNQDENGYVNVEFKLIDVDNHDLYYKIVDYDDGITEPSEWFGPKKSMESIVFEHQFPERGKYHVRLQTRDDPAKDGWDGLDGKSFDFSFPIKRGRPHLNLFKLEIHNLFFDNIGNTDIKYNLNCEGLRVK